MADDPNRAAHQPLLLWLMNGWAAAEPLLREATAKLDAKHDTLVLDVRTKRGEAVSTLSHEQVFRAAKVAELSAIREVLSSHPFLYNTKWCKGLSTFIKQVVKSKRGGAGCCCLFAYGDHPEHAPDQDNPMPNFDMNVAPYFVADLNEIARVNLPKQITVHRGLPVASPPPSLPPSPPPSPPSMADTPRMVPEACASLPAPVSSAGGRYRIRDFAAADDAGCKALELSGGFVTPKHPVGAMLIRGGFTHAKRFDAKATQFDSSHVIVCEDTAPPPGEPSIVGVVMLGIKEVTLRGSRLLVGYTFDLRVHGHAQRSGIGMKLCAEVEARSLAAGVHTSYLSVNGDNERAKKLYARLNYVLASYRAPKMEVCSSQQPPRPSTTFSQRLPPWPPPSDARRCRRRVAQGGGGG